VGEHEREGGLRDDPAKIGSWAVVSAPRSKLSCENSRRVAVSRAECSPSTDWRNACGNCGNFPDGVAIRVSPSVGSGAALIGVTLAEIAEIRRGVHLVSAYGRWSCISERACAQNSACNVLFQPECNRIP
jgi:hypothetical protein